MPPESTDLTVALDILKANYRREAEWRRAIEVRRDRLLEFLAAEVAPALDEAVALLSDEHVANPCGDADCASVVLPARLLKLRADDRFMPTVTVPPEA